jgi:preprotein translocase subunit SecF
MILGLKNTIVAVLITAVAGYVYSNYQLQRGIELGMDSQRALQAEVDTKVQEAKEELTKAVVEGLKGITVENKTIYQKATKEVLTKEIYKECIVPQEGKDIIKKAMEPRR